MMAVTVIDSGDMDAMLADAGVEVEKPAAQADDEKPQAKAYDKTAASEVDPDDVEDEQGITPRERRELTERTRRLIGKKHRQLKEAEEFAADQYNGKRLAEQRAEDLARENAELRAKLPPDRKHESAMPEKPQRQNFATDDEYLDAMIQFGVDQRLAEQREKDAKEAAEQARQKIMDAATSRMNRAMEIVPDYREVIEDADAIVPPAIANYMGKSEMIAELGYHFAKNPDVLVSLAKLPPDEQLVQIGKIESILSPFEPREGKTAAQNDTTSSQEASNGKPHKAAPSADSTGLDLSKPRGKAAPVITPLDATGSAGIQKDPADMNIRESIEDFSRRNRVNLGMRKRH
jgi:hypothetical protein